MTPKGPPKFFENKPKGPTAVPRPSVKTGRGKGGGKGPGRTMPGSSGKAKSSFFGVGESWKTYVVIVASAILFVGIAYNYIVQSYRQLDQGQGAAEMALVAATLEAIQNDLGGLTLSDEARTDKALIAILQDVAEGGKLIRDANGAITGSEPPASGEDPLFTPPLPDSCATGDPFQFVFSEGDESGLPSIQVGDFGVLSPPLPSSKDWRFEGDLTYVQRQLAIGGELVTVTIKRGDGASTVMTLFKRLETPAEGS